jgi:long-chain fatty acid transport protein
MKKMGRSVVAAGACLALTGAAREAGAAGFATAHFGGEQGSVVATNPTALYFNPGALGFSEGIHLFVDGDIALRHATWSHVAPAPGPSDPADSQAGNTGTAHLFNVFAGPSLAASAKFGNFAFGVGLFVPFGGRVNWHSNDNTDLNYPLTAGGVQRWHMEDAALTFLQISAGVAYKLGPLSVGAAGNFINSQITESEGRTVPGYVDSTAENTAHLDVAGNNGSFAAGAMLEAIPNHLWLAGSYQAQPGMGEQILKGSFTFDAGPQPQYEPHDPLVQKVDFHEQLPDIIRAGIRLRATDDFEVRLFGDLTRWSKLTSQCINVDQGGSTACLVKANGSDATPNKSVIANIVRDWKDTYGAHIGASYWVNPQIEIFAGGGYETGAAPDATVEPGAMDGNNISGSIGGRFLIANYVYFAASYTHLQFVNRDVTTSQLASVDGKPVSLPTAQQDGNGQYTQWVGFFDLNLEKQF